MFKIKRNAFTLIELVAVLVIMAIIALIVTPLVMSIIRKARISADKRSIDAYGRSIELAIAGFLMDNGSFPTSIDQLTIEYSGDEVVCTTTQLNSDSSIYLAECSVGGRSVDGYTYGSDKSPSYTAYSVGDEVTYNGVDYYVIKDSSASEDTVKLLKAEPLSAEEITTYSAGTGTSIAGNGGMQYGITSDYSTSYVKQVVEAWKIANAPLATEARLITIDELIENFGYELVDNGSVIYAPLNEKVPNWVWKNNQYPVARWTMSLYGDSTSRVWRIDLDGKLVPSNVNEVSIVVRPVIVLPKSAI